MEKKYPLKPHTDEWELKALKLRASFAPSAYACKKCGAPVLFGYRCEYCGDSNPSATKEEDDEN